MLIHPWDEASADEWHDVLALVLSVQADRAYVEAARSDRRQLPGIRGVRIRVEGVRAKQKYGGNKTPEHRRAIAEHLAERDAPGDEAARGHLLRRTAPRVS